MNLKNMNKNMDKRNQAGIDKIMTHMDKSRTSVINGFDHANQYETDSIYRSLKNEKVTIELMKEYLVKNYTHLKNKNIIYIPLDKSEFNFHSQRGRHQKEDPNIGLVSNNSSHGIIVLSSIAVDPIEKHSLGVLDVQFIVRKPIKKDSSIRNHKQLPFTEKESSLWLTTALNSAKYCPEDAQKVIIIDREGDIYELFIHLEANGLDFIIRSNFNRNIYLDEEQQEQENVRTYLKGSPSRGTWEIEVEKNKNRVAHRAKLNVHYEKRQLNLPQQLKKEGFEDCFVTVVYVEEVDAPEGSEPVEWLLYTSLPVESLSDAEKVVEGYKMRWLIEEGYRISKTKGFNMESSQLSRGLCLQKMILMTLHLANKSLALKQTRDREDLPANLMLSHDQIKVLEIGQPKMEGRTQKLKNPWKKYSLAWAVWLIGRLGGWKMRGKPGVITMTRGLIALEWKMAGYYEALEYMQSQEKEKW